jgi:hypothetical protein
VVKVSLWALNFRHLISKVSVGGYLYSSMGG